jgi:ubiquinone/menaquinone biosynthesis C-methylase UbiE
VGCGTGKLRERLQAEKGADGRDMEISQGKVNQCVARGLSVIQGDANSDLVCYPDKALNVVVMSQALLATRRPKPALEGLLRIGSRVYRLACATLAAVALAQAGDARPTLILVQHAQHPFLHSARLLGAVRESRRLGGARRSAQCRQRPRRLVHALMFLELLRAAGGLRAAALS